MKILHITPHLGAGVGQALSSLALCKANKHYGMEHEFLLLETPISRVFYDKCVQNEIEVYLNSAETNIDKLIKSADIVQIEWWNHPLITKLLYDYRNIEMRLSVWAHISGCVYPYISPNFIALPDSFFFSTPYSFESPAWSIEERKTIKDKAKVAMSCPNYGKYAEIKRTEHETFNIGYVGALDFFKIHADFIKICAEIDIPDVKFIIVGDGPDASALKEQAEKAGIASRFEFTGFVENVAAQIANFDIFLYPLQKEHTGTMEQVVLEAMASSLPCVLLNQSSERYLIEHLKTGILANGVTDIPKWVNFLYNNKEKREQLGSSAARHINEKLTTEKMIEVFYEQYSKMMGANKRLYDISAIGNEPSEWFLNSCGPFYEVFVNEKEYVTLPLNMKMTRRGSLAQYASTFKEDSKLKRWAELWLR